MYTEFMGRFYFSELKFEVAEKDNEAQKFAICKPDEMQVSIGKMLRTCILLMELNELHIDLSPLPFGVAP